MCNRTMCLVLGRGHRFLGITKAKEILCFKQEVASILIKQCL